MSLKISSDFISNLAGNSDTRRDKQIDRFEKRRDRLDDNFDKLQQEALESGDIEKAKKIFEVSQLFEDKLDNRLDRLRVKNGMTSADQSRQIDDVFDDLQEYAYSQNDTALAKKILGLSQAVKGYSSGSSDSRNELLLKQLLSDSLETKSSTSTDTSTSTGTGAGTGTGASTSTGASTKNT